MMGPDPLGLLRGLAGLSDELREALATGNAVDWDRALKRCQRLGARIRKLDASALAAVDRQEAGELIERVRRAFRALEEERETVGDRLSRLHRGRRALKGYAARDGERPRGRLRRRA